MLIIEVKVVVHSANELDSMILREVSNILPTPTDVHEGGRILETGFNIMQSSPTPSLIMTS